MGNAARKVAPIKAPSFEDMLAKTAKPKVSAKKAKTKVPVINTPKDIKGEVDRYIGAKLLAKQAKADMDDSGDMIIGFARDHQDVDGYAGMFRHSYTVQGNKDNVKYVSSNRFSVNADDEEQLMEILGNSFDDMFDKTFEVTLKAEVFQDEDLKAELMELVGAQFGTFFDTKVSLKVKEEFDRRMYGIVEAAELPVLRTFARPYKPSLR